jgi:hypothetical protein
MERREFIITTGGFVSATMLATFLEASPLMTLTSNTLNIDRKERDDYSQFDKPILKALAIGLNAPSAHNTQAWKFKIISDTEAEIYIDETRLLPQTDPPTRQIHISGGCFLETIAIGTTLFNYETTVSLFPKGEYALIEIGQKPFASLKLTPQEKVNVHPLADHIFNRQTSRLVYESELISDETKDKLIKESASGYSRLIIQNKQEEIKPYLDLFKEAMKIESFNLPTNEETRIMFRFNSDEIETKRDGLTFEGQGTNGMAKVFAKMAVKNNEESWNKKSNVDAGLEKFNNGVDSSKGLVYWITETNTFQDWINVGRDITNFLLVLTKNDLYAHPLNQGIQEYKAMDEIRIKLDSLMKITNQQKIQMIVRIGKSEKPFISYRRHLNDLIKG